MPMLTVDKLNDVVDIFDIDSEQYPICVESGTYLGETVKMMQPYFEEFHTIEISPLLYQNFFQEHPNYENVSIHLGDSSKVIPELLKSFNETQKCVFWLDGHYSSGITSKGDKDVPLLEECDGINSFYKPDEGLVLIDDLILFETSNCEDWSEINIDNILKCFSNFNIKSHNYQDDILCLYLTRK